jgi:heme/copper-type cytochrome/quinol oxidase subunit 2
MEILTVGVRKTKRRRIAWLPQTTTEEGSHLAEKTGIGSGIRRAALLALGLWALGCDFSTHKYAPEPGAGFATDSTNLQVVSAVVGGKNVFVPSTIVVTAGTPYTLSVYNGTDGPHGFAIAGAGVEVILQPKEEAEIPLPALEAGNLYRVHCHLHGAHRAATLVVVPKS